MKQIKDFPNYFVTEDGRVWSEYSNKFLKPYTNRRGYCLVDLWRNGLGKTKKVHRLVAQAYIPNPENKPEVNHKDGVKSNNCVENLEWMTSAENHLHALDVLGRTMPSGEAHVHSKLNNAKVKSVRSMLAKGISQTTIGKLYGVSNRTISSVHRGVTWCGV